jgi:hypothetical protein
MQLAKQLLASNEKRQWKFVIEVTNKFKQLVVEDVLVNYLIEEDKIYINFDMDSVSTELKIEFLKEYVTQYQYNAFKSNSGTFKTEIDFLFKTIVTMPTTYEQDSKGNESIAYLHYFVGNNDCYITERDILEENDQHYGVVSLSANGNEPEFTYISLNEVLVCMEIDFYFKPKMIKDIKF